MQDGQSIVFDGQGSWGCESCWDIIEQTVRFYQGCIKSSAEIYYILSIRIVSFMAIKVIMLKKAWQVREISIAFTAEIIRGIFIKITVTI